jgi:hypothetical protein
MFAKLADFHLIISLFMLCLLQTLTAKLDNWITLDRNQRFIVLSIHSRIAILAYEELLRV